MKRDRKRGNLATKALALLLIGLFGFQLARVYVLSKADIAYACPYTVIWVTKIGPDGTRQLVASTPPAPSLGDGPSVWGCPGNLNGMLLSPVQPTGLPVSNLCPEPPFCSELQVPARIRFSFEASRTPPFQPPRA